MVVKKKDNTKKKGRGRKRRHRRIIHKDAERILRHFIDIGVGVIPLWGITPDGKCQCGRSGCSSPGKHPQPRYAPNGLKSAITDWAAVKKILAENPDGNWGIATEGLVVIDVDAGRDGYETIIKLYAEQEDVPDTVLVRTGGMGAHIYYKAPPGVAIKNSVDRIGPGVDLRASGGLIVIPPSQHASGLEYRFEDGFAPGEVEIAELPGWLFEIIQQAGHSAKSDAHAVSDHVTGIPEGKRNETLTRVAGVLVNQGVRGAALFNGIQAVNQGCCNPKLPTFEVKTIADSIGGYGFTRDVAAAMPPQEPFPLEVFPKSLSEFLMTSSDSLGCPVSMIAPHTLPVAAGAIGNARRIQLKEGWCEPSVIWLFTVAPSGSLKSPAMELAVKPAELHQQLAMDAYEKAIAKWRRLPPDEQRDEPEPRPGRSLVNDVTVESLAGILGYNPRGLLLYADEGAGWIEGFNAYGGGAKGDEAKWLTVFGARQLIIDRKTGPEPLILIPRAAVSICGSIQPGVLARLITQAHKDSGLAARLLLVQPDQHPKKWTEQRISSKAVQQYIECMRRLYTVEPRRVRPDGTYVPRNLKLADDALALWRSFYDAHNEEAAGLVGELAARWAKLEAYAARFALVLRHLHWAFKEAESHTPLNIDAKSMAGGIRLARWFAGETNRIHGVVSVSTNQGFQDKAVEQIKKLKGAVTASSLGRASSRFKPLEKAQEVLDALVEAGRGKWVPPQKNKRGGRPTQTFVLTDPYTSTKGTKNHG